MGALEPSVSQESFKEIGRVGRIPVRNLWLLMLYASELFRHRAGDRITAEENPDDIPDLVAEILAGLVERRLKRNLNSGFQPRQDVLTRLRGRINTLQTNRRHLLEIGKVACRFECLTVDTPRNRLVRAALEVISKVVRRSALAQRCRSLASVFRSLGVSGDSPTRAQISAERLGLRDTGDLMMVEAALLALELALPTEISGARRLFAPEREFAWVCKLFEKAAAGFYDITLSPLGWRVRAGETIRWPAECMSPGMERILPTMRTDVVLANMATRRRIVIDTKFNSILVGGFYRDESLRSGYLYQIYSYLRSQEREDDPLSRTASGLLLHPTVGVQINESTIIQGHEIRFATVDLGSEARHIRTQLLAAIGLNVVHG